MSTFKKLGASLLRNGYQIIPIPVGKKGPIVPNWREVAPKNENEFTNFVTGRHEVETDEGVKHLPNVRDADGIGILTTRTPAVDIDCYNEAVSAHMEQFVRDNLDEGLLRIGQWPKRLFVYRTDEPFTKVTSARFIDPADPKKRKQRIEVLGDGQQFVAYHVHPDTGMPYTWPDDWMNPEDVAVEDLPLIGVEHARAVCREFERHVTELGWEKVDGREDGGGAGDGDVLALDVPPAEEDDEIARVKAALEHISPDCSREDYLTVLAALKWTRWMCGEELARAWAEGSVEGKFNESDFSRDWKSFKPEKGAKTIQIGSLYGLAKAAGWDASRPKKEKPIEEIRLSQGDFLTMAAELKKDDSAGAVELLRKVRDANLDSLTVESILKEISTRTKLGMPAVRKAFKETRMKEGDGATHATYARKFINHIEDKSTMRPVGVEGKIFSFDKRDGVWDGRQPNLMTDAVATLFDGLDGCTRRADYLAIATHAMDILTPGNESFFTDAPIGMACSGRFYTVADDGEIRREPLEASHRQRVTFPVAPRVGDMPMFERFLDQTFKGDRDHRQRDLLQEVIGATVLGFFYRYEKVVLLYGPGRSGKGTITKIILALMPKKVVSAVPPHKWENEYYAAELAGSRLNLVGEIPEEGAIDGAMLKSVSGRDEISARRPGEMPFKFTNMASHIFNGNYFPPTRDQSDAFFSRWVLMDFRNTLIGHEEMIDKDLAEKIIAAELPQISAWALQGAKRLLARGHLDLPVEHHALMERWRGRSNSLSEFLHDRDEVRLSDHSNAWVRRPVLYQAYSMWCRDSGRKAMAKGKVYELLETPKFVAMGLSMAKRDGYDVVRGVMLKSDAFFNVEDTREEEEAL